ncbi:BLUF domain-containing protein [Glycocaulis alkaliphilus]|uniref:BLUF domain-containing protein n=1 Tax=Glycocaulis alkaliphilus TaxID=1434191 RepID=A0A3T0E5R3_9PROT|nr:BLUF domain-containing protein [Glycocaulis alkaliphilus]
MYVSTAHPDLMLSDIDAIVDTARARNEAEGVTGLLIYNGFNFMQLLEGPPESVEQVFASICKDTRHTGVVPVLSGEADARVFGGWTMAYARTASGHGEGPLALTTDALKAYLPEDLSPELHMLFVSFNTMSNFEITPPAGDDIQPAQ